MNKWLWSLLCVTLLGAAACSDDDTEGDSGNPIPPALSTENLPDAGLKFLYSALTPHTFTMSVDAPWEITKTAGWFVVTPNKGEAGQNIQVTVTPTLNQGEARDGEFTIRANSGNNLHPCLTQKSIPLSQDAYLAAGIVITGLDERLLAFEAEDTDPVVFTVEASYDWTLTVENETWLTVAPKSGKAGSAAEVTITPKANTTDERHESKITITAGDAEFGENTAEEIIELVQAPYMPKDTHTEGYVFFSDDFQWIPDNWVSPYTKYGWPSVSIDGTNGNEFALSTDGMKEAVAAKGYIYTPSVYARYEGHVKLGKTANMGAITIPALTGIDAGKAATLLVQFDAAAYSSAGGAVDNGDDHMDVTIKGPGTIGDLVETTALVEVKNVWEWTRYSLIVYGATNETRITFGSEREVKCRLYLDNITVTRAKDENPEAPAPEALVTPLDKEIVNTSDPSLFDANSMVVAEGGTLTCSVRVNKAWTAETDCDWLTITTVRCGDADPSTVTGANNGASLSNGVATVKATGLPYVTTKVEVGRNSGGESRTGHIIIKSEGAEIEKVAVTQASGAQITIEGLTDNTLELSDNPAESGAEVKFTVNAPYPWTIAPSGAAAWYEVSPGQGAANTDVEVTVKALEQNLSFRRFGEFYDHGGRGRCNPYREDRAFAAARIARNGEMGLGVSRTMVVLGRGYGQLRPGLQGRARQPVQHGAGPIGAGVPILYTHGTERSRQEMRTHRRQYGPSVHHGRLAGRLLDVRRPGDEPRRRHQSPLHGDHPHLGHRPQILADGVQRRRHLETRRGIANDHGNGGRGLLHPRHESRREDQHHGRRDGHLCQCDLRRQHRIPVRLRGQLAGQRQGRTHQAQRRDDALGRSRNGRQPENTDCSLNRP